MIFYDYLRILRIPNALMASGAVLIGYWLSNRSAGYFAPIILSIVAALSTGFGNVINDIIDLESDKINHSDRPLPRGTISKSNAILYCIALAAVALLAGFIVSPLHGIATFLPLSLLIIYSFFLKKTPLAGNILVALLVAYSLMFGALGSSQLHNLVIPSLLAFLLNICREIIKDLEDEAGDKACGITTSAALPPRFLNNLIYIVATIYVPLTFIPYYRGSFGLPYLIVCVLVVLPIHGAWLTFFRKSGQANSGLHKSALLLKLEMLAGLLALVADRAFV